MSRPKRVEVEPRTISSPPSSTPEGRENQIIALAYDLAEKQLLEGTASSQVITHLLRAGSSRDKLERAILIKQEKLVSAKAEAIESQKRIEALYEDAIKAFGLYNGGSEIEDADIQ